MKVVLDSNVILAGFATHGLCESVVEACLDAHEIVLSEAILDEVRRHLGDKFKMPPARIREVVAFLREHAHIVEPVDVRADACRDPDDLVVLGTAVAAGADCLVTGDADRLALRAFQGVPILSPRDSYGRLR